MPGRKGLTIVSESAWQRYSFVMYIKEHLHVKLEGGDFIIIDIDWNYGEIRHGNS